MYRSTVPKSDNKWTVFITRKKLVVAGDRIRLAGSVKAAFRLIHIGCCNCSAQSLHADAVTRQCQWIGLDAHRRLLAAADGDKANTQHLRNFLRQSRLGEVLHFRKRKRLRGER